MNKKISSLNKIQKLKLLYNFFQLYKIWKGVGMKNLLMSKKSLTTLIGIITVILINVIGINPDQAKTITDAIMIIVGIYLGAQGIADGLSKGVTSSNPQNNNAGGK